MVVLASGCEHRADSISTNTKLIFCHFEGVCLSNRAHPSSGATGWLLVAKPVGPVRDRFLKVNAKAE